MARLMLLLLSAIAAVGISAQSMADAEYVLDSTDSYTGLLLFASETKPGASTV